MGKLVRDKIPDIIAKGGRSVTYRTLVGEEHKQALVKKLAEEYKELINALADGGEDAILEESCDLLQVVMDLTYHMTKRSTALERVTINKAVKAGTFSKGIYLEDSSQ